jgi:single-strand DNA-binding protein
MAGVNKVILVGNLGRDPEARNMQSGGKVVSFSIATSETWNDKASGERKEKTQWHRIAIFNEKLGEIAEKYLKKGSKVYLEGALESRKYTDKDGQEREITEIVLGRFKGELTLLDSRGGGEAGEGGGGGGYGGGRSSSGGYGGGERAGGGRGGGGGWDSKPKGGADLDDDIPF